MVRAGALGVNIREAHETNILLFLSKGKHRCISSLYEFYFIIVLKLLFDLCIYVIGVE
jgi:hypothetical protein